jgi:hypothetical protein|tara:strand:+ start:242 stop:553 length:312 start_codon:yes stop_codon:yes gene_type:complete
MTHSVKWLTSNEAAAARYKRITDGKKYPMITHQYVVHIELNGRMENLERFQEIDADDISHALALVKQWLKIHHVTSAAIRKVKRGGSLGSPDIYDLSDFMEEK